MLGETLLVAPIFMEEGTVDYYLPAGRWTNLLSGQVQEGPAWHHGKHGFLSMPLHGAAGYSHAAGRYR